MKGEEKDKSSPGQAWLWVVVLAGPAVWLMQFQARYSLVPLACAAGHPAVIGIVGIAGAVISAAAAVASWRIWTTAGKCWPDDLTPPPSGRTLFLGILGMLTGSLFTLVIIAQLIPTLFFSPCQL